MGAGGIKRHVHIEGERGEGRCGGVGVRRVRGGRQGERGGKADVEG